MAGDWIKFDKSTPDKPEVWAIASALNVDPDAVVGKLMRVWSWFDEQSEEGNAPAVTKMLLDRRVGVTGFCQEMISAGWMQEDDGQLLLPNFDRHNGQTSKNRALTAKRVAKHKAQSNAKGNADSVNSALPREEKRREDINLTPTEYVDAPAPTPINTIPHEKIRELYNQILGDNLSRCLGLTDKHRKGIKACYSLKLDGVFPVREGGLEFWEGLFNDVLDCPFMLGMNNRSWKADFEFLTTSTKLQRFMEGKYDNAA